MPLMHGKSDKAFSHNVRAEMNAGKPQKQALAIAYHEKRARKANGGAVDSGEGDNICAPHGMASCQTCDADDMSKPDKPAPVTGGYAGGGMIDRIMAKRHPDTGEHEDTEEGEEAHEPDGASIEDPEPEEERDDMIGRIMRKRMAGK